MPAEYTTVAAIVFVISLIVGMVLNELDTDPKKGDEHPTIVLWSVMVALLWPIAVAAIVIFGGIGLGYWLLLQLVRRVVRLFKKKEPQ